MEIKFKKLWIRTLKYKILRKIGKKKEKGKSKKRKEKKKKK
jgi:hypothetical protein